MTGHTVQYYCPVQHTSATAAENAIVTTLATTPTWVVTPADAGVLLGMGVVVVELVLPTVLVALEDDEWSMEPIVESLDLAGAVALTSALALALLPSSMGAPTPARKPVPLLAASSALTHATTSVRARTRTLESFIVEW